MKHLRFAFIGLVSALGVLHAQDDEQRRAPPVEIPDFSNLDEYIYEPKSTLVFGFRHISGAKLSFASGTGQILSRNSPGDDITSVVQRTYQDGAVQLDTRTTTVTDDAGATSVVAITPDGKTNTWNYSDLSQRSREGFVAFRDYSADILGAATQSKDSNSTNGMDLAVHRDMGKLFGTRMAWTLTAGMSINDISASTAGAVRARINSTTDFYRFYPPAGGSLQDPPYSAPSSTSVNVTDGEGNPVLDTENNPIVVTTDTTVLLDSRPADRVRSNLINETSVTNRWKVKGAYYTFRAGPTLWVPITTRLRASVSVGAALVYSGTTYTVTETFAPEVGAEISETESSEDYKLLPGYYADATLQFDLTERAGFYAGAIYQSAGDYTQVVENGTTSYSTKIDLSKQSGVRAGMTIRF